MKVPKKSKSNKSETKSKEQVDPKSQVKQLTSSDIAEFSKKTEIRVDPRCMSVGKNSLIYYASKGVKNYALKVITLDPDSKNLQLLKELTKNEMLITSNLNNKNCIKCYGCFDMPFSRIIVLERAVNKDLKFLTDLFYQGKLFSYINFKQEDKGFKNHFLF